MTEPPLPDDREHDQFLTYDEAAHLLKVKKATLAWWVHEGTVPFVRLGPRTVRFRRAQLEDWLSARSGGAMGGAHADS